MSSKTTTTATKEEAKPALVPKLRFPEFQRAERWQPKRLGLALKFQPGFPFPSAGFNDAGKGLRLIRNRDLRSDDIVIFYSDEFDSNFVVKNGDVLVGMDGDFTPTVWEKGDALLNQRVGRIIPRGDSDQKFLLYLLTLSLKRIEEATARTTVKHLSHSAVEDRDEPIPSPAEQQKIADCLESVDELIAAQARKVEALKTHKKGVMQQLFPREGEAQPSFRFPEFQNAGAWEVSAIGDLFRVTRGEVLSMSLVQDVASSESPFPVYSSQTKNKGLAGYYSEYLYEDAITWTTDGANAGDVNFRPGKFYCTNVCGVLINTKGYANDCIAALLNGVTRSHVSYVGNPKLMNGVMAKIEIPFPSVPEQKRIATFLGSIDALITAEILKLDALKTHKKGLMQQLFPSAEEVEV